MELNPNVSLAARTWGLHFALLLFWILNPMTRFRHAIYNLESSMQPLQYNEWTVCKWWRAENGNVCVNRSGTTCDCGRYQKVVGQLDVSVGRLKNSAKFIKNGKLKFSQWGRKYMKVQYLCELVGNKWLPDVMIVYKIKYCDIVIYYNHIITQRRHVFLEKYTVYSHSFPCSSQIVLHRWDLNLNGNASSALNIGLLLCSKFMKEKRGLTPSNTCSTFLI